MSPLERAARALAKRNYPGASDADIDEMWDGYIEDARAVLTAIREPSEEMLRAAYAGLSEHEPPRPEDAWRLMLDAIDARDIDRIDVGQIDAAMGER